MEDLRFIRRCIKRDKKSWDEFVQLYSSLIYNYIYKILLTKGYPLDQSIISDIYQEIFFSLIKDNFKKLRQFKAKNGATLASWLRVITINCTLDSLRRRRPVISLEENLSAETISLKERLPDKKFSYSDEILLNKEKLEILADCINSLNVDDKFLIEMNIYRNISLDKLKQSLRLSSRSAIDMRKARLIKRLRECFKKRGFDLGV